MATLTQNVAGLIPGMQSIALASHAAGMIPKDFGPKTPKQMRQQNRKMMRGSMNILVGVPLIGATSKMVNAL